MKSNQIILCLDTATTETVVGLYHSGEITEIIGDGKKRADDLLPTIERILTETHTKLIDLTAIAVRRGLGSYTGLRVGATVANTLTWSLDIPIFGVFSRDERKLETKEILAKTLPQISRQKDKPTSPRLIVPKYAPWASR